MPAPGHADRTSDRPNGQSTSLASAASPSALTVQPMAGAGRAAAAPAAVGGHPGRGPEVATEPRRVLLVGSSGGHLAQLFSLESWWRARERRWVTFRTADAEDLLAHEDVVWAHHPTTRNVPNLIRNFWLAMHLMPRYRPDLVVSTGAGVALPFFVLAHSMGIRTSYIEVYDRIDTPTLTTRLCRPLTDVLCAQWAEQRRFLPDAEVIGRLL